MFIKFSPYYDIYKLSHNSFVYVNISFCGQYHIYHLLSPYLYIFGTYTI